MTQALLAKDATIAAADIDLKGLQETGELAGQDAERRSTHLVDITNRAAVQALPGAVLTEPGAIAGLINNTGIIQPFIKVNDLEYDASDRVMKVNIRGALNM